VTEASLLSPARLFAHLEWFGERTAIVRADGVSWTYLELAEAADQWAAGLGETRGLLAVEMANAWEPLVAWIGASRAGFPVLLLAEGQLAKEPRLRGQFAPEFEFKREEGAMWCLTAREVSEANALQGDLALLLTTSGSAGDPKLVRLSARNLISNARSIAHYLGLTPSDRAVTSLPMHYSYGVSVVSSHLTSGGSIALTERSPLEDAFWSEFEAMQATSFAGVPITYELLEEKGFPDRAVSGLRTMTQAGGRMEPERVKRFAAGLRKQGGRFWVMYGQTEASPRITFLPPEMAESFPDRIGYPVPGGYIRLVNTDGQAVTEVDSPGELCYTGLNVMMGYAMSRADLALGAGAAELRTGDIAERDAAGRYKIVGRSSRWVKVVGLRISLDGIETDMRRDGVRCHVAGTEGRIVVAVTDGADPVKLQAEWAGRLGIPSGALRVIALQEIPTLTTGKPNYGAILRAGTGDGGAPGDWHKAGAGLRAELKSVLKVAQLDGHESFKSAGGDSLNFMEGAIAVERYFGRRVPGWESIPMDQLCLGEPEVRPRAGGEDPLVVARTVAIGLTMLSHIIFKLEVWWMVPQLFFVTALATPLLLVVFGASIERAVGGRPVGRSVRGLMSRYWPMAVTFYGAILITLFFQFISGNETLEKTLKALIFNEFGKYAGIWMTYCAMVVVVPFLIAAVERWGGWAVFVILQAQWLIWPWLGEIDMGPYFWAFLFGVHNLTGPSVLHSTTFVLFGYLWSRAGKGWPAVVGAGAMILLAEVVIWWNVVEIGWTGVWLRYGFQDYRQFNHPVYFAIGILGAALVLLLSKGWSRKNRFGGRGGMIFSLGRNPLFAYVLTNVLLCLTPAMTVIDGQSLVWSAGLVVFVVMMTDDVTRWQPRFFGPVARGLRWFNLRLLGLQTLGDGVSVRGWFRRRGDAVE
jgi:acyl-CoA synthetase (AMP-forming)/AMP-acid ligase II